MSGPTALGRVLLAGGSGLVGQALLQQLSTDPDVTELSALLRRPVPLPAGVVPLISDFEQLADHPEWFQVDTVFCALGTTIAKAGSQAAFQRVDLDYPLALARLAKAGGARHFLVVSALGANARSRVFYNRVKGQMEQGLSAT
ncbi:MAG TPA: NAD(P)H-binding protein [Aquabacterium sp.]|nr:NAD(P)H-binding protein [Aquabacterium sp.]